ncbi:unnamed protein product, partial [Closterium sp. NIES-53]
RPVDAHSDGGEAGSSGGTEGAGVAAVVGDEKHGAHLPAAHRRRQIPLQRLVRRLGGQQPCGVREKWGVGVGRERK